MSDKKYVVPEDGFNVACKAIPFSFVAWHQRLALEAFIRWQDENLPENQNQWTTRPLAERLCLSEGYMQAIVDVRRMYLAPEPEVQCNHLKREYQEPLSGNWKCLGCGNEFRTIYPPASLAIFEEK